MCSFVVTDVHASHGLYGSTTRLDINDSAHMYCIIRCTITLYHMACFPARVCMDVMRTAPLHSALGGQHRDHTKPTACMHDACSQSPCEAQIVSGAGARPKFGPVAEPCTEWRASCYVLFLSLAALSTVPCLPARLSALQTGRHVAKLCTCSELA